MKRFIPVMLLTTSMIGFFTAGGYISKAQQGAAYPPVLVQATNTTTDAAGNWTVTWAQPFQSASPFVAPLAVVSTGNNPIDCAVVSRTANTATGWCRQSTVTVLNLSIVTAGLSLNPFANIPATSTTVMVIGRDVTQ